MPAKKPRTKPAEERRRELLDAAQRLFIKQGVEPTTIEQITITAGVAKGSFYLHFPGKTELLLALRKRFVLDGLAEIEAAVQRRPQNDWTGRLLAWADASIAGYLAAKPLHDVVFQEFGGHKQEDHGGDLVPDYLAAILADGNSARAWKVDDPGLTARFLFHGLHGLVHESLLQDRRLGRARLTGGFRQLCLRIVGAA